MPAIPGSMMKTTGVLIGALTVGGTALSYKIGRDAVVSQTSRKNDGMSPTDWLKTAGGAAAGAVVLGAITSVAAMRPGVSAAAVRNATVAGAIAGAALVGAGFIGVTLND